MIYNDRDIIYLKNKYNFRNNFNYNIGRYTINNSRDGKYNNTTNNNILYNWMNRINNNVIDNNRNIFSKGLNSIKILQFWKDQNHY